MRVTKVKVNLREVKVVIQSSRLSSLYNYVAEAFDGTVRGYVKQHVETAVRVNISRLLNLINQKIGGHWDLVQRVFQDNQLLRNWGDPNEAAKACNDATWKHGLVRWKGSKPSKTIDQSFKNNGHFYSDISLQHCPVVAIPRASLMSKIKLRLNASSDTDLDNVVCDYESGSDTSSLGHNRERELRTFKTRSLFKKVQRRSTLVDPPLLTKPVRDEKEVVSIF